MKRPRSGSGSFERNLSFLGKARILDRVSFLLSLGRYRVSVFNYTPEELEREVVEAKLRAG